MMEQEPRNIVLNPHAAELLRAAHERHPELSAAEILEQALSARFGREAESVAPRIRTGEEIQLGLMTSPLFPTGYRRSPAKPSLARRSIRITPSGRTGPSGR